MSQTHKNSSENWTSVCKCELVRFVTLNSTAQFVVVLVECRHSIHLDTTRRDKNDVIHWLVDKWKKKKKIRKDDAGGLGWSQGAYGWEENKRACSSQKLTGRQPLGAIELHITKSWIMIMGGIVSNTKSYWNWVPDVMWCGRRRAWVRVTVMVTSGWESWSTLRPLAS